MDVLVKWKKDGSQNIVSAEDLHLDGKRSIKKGATVQMRGKYSWWKGKVISIFQRIGKIISMNNSFVLDKI